MKPEDCKTMDPVEQRIAICVSRGWTDVERVTAWSTAVVGISPAGVYKAPPDYLEDRAAMVEAIETLDDQQLIGFAEWMRQLHYYDGFGPLVVGRLLCAGAPKLAEALLKCLGKWEEAK